MVFFPYVALILLPVFAFNCVNTVKDPGEYVSIDSGYESISQEEEGGFLGTDENLEIEIPEGQSAGGF